MINMSGTGESGEKGRGRLNSSVLSTFYQLPAQNLTGRSSTEMLRIAEHFRQLSEC